MNQVELNLNKKLAIVRFTPATKTILDKFSDGKGFRLKVPFGEEQQANAKLLFKVHAGVLISTSKCHKAAG
jgi:hypothetical protein